MKTMLRTIALCLLFVPGPKSGFAQTITDDVMQAMHEKAAQEIEASLQEDTLPADGAGWDEYWRTSDMEGEQPSMFNRYSRAPKGTRIGCICMDGTRSDERGRGACSGFGGVRYWVYLVEGDSTVLFPTQKHWEHPEPLNDLELSNLSSRNTGQAYGKSKAKGGGIGPYETLAILGICACIAYVAKLMFDPAPKA